MLNLIKVTIIASGLLFSCLSYADWGAEGVASSNRTNQNWENSFPSTPTITVGPTGDVATISEGIANCNNLSAATYCFVKVQAGVYEISSEIQVLRSRTKLSGSISGITKIKSTSPNSIFIWSGGSSLLSKVVVENLFIDGQYSSGPNLTNRTGISIYGAGMADISIKNNTIDGIYADNFVNSSDDFIAGASAISVSGSGTNEAQSIRNLLIESNTITNMKNGYSENISVNGNIKRWEIKNNTIDNITNIGIDAIGGENTSSGFAVNAARYGFIENNKVTNLVEPAAKTEGVAAIYVDGGRNILIQNNTVNVASHGYVIGAENCVVTSNITMIGNTSLNAVFEDLSLGGYSSQGYTYGVDSECDGGGGGHGSVENITVNNNTFNSQGASPLNSNDSNFPVQVNYRITSAIVNQNGIIEVNETGTGSAPAGQNAIRKTFPSSNLPELTSHSGGDTISGSSETFTWISNGYNVSSYWLDIGSTPGGDDIKSINLSASTTSHIFSGLPTDGRTLYVRLYYNANFDFVPYQLTANVIPELTSPSNGTTLSGSTQTFRWISNGYNVSSYWLDIGSTLGDDDIKSINLSASTTSHTFSGLPTDGSTLYIRLYYNTNFDFVPYQFTASGN